jgi:uroporphyrinogen-III synthase
MPVRFPVLEITGRTPESIAADLESLPRPDIIIFVSRNAVRYGLPAIGETGASVAAIGPSTAAALTIAGRHVDIVPASGFDSEALLAERALRDLRDRHVLIIRGKSGRELLAEELRQRGAEVSYLPVYQRERCQPDADSVVAISEAFRNGNIDAVTVLSVETLENLLALLPGDVHARLRETPLVAPGDRVIQTACALVPGIPAIQAAGPRAADMLNALIDWRHSGKHS